MPPIDLPPMVALRATQVLRWNHHQRMEGLAPQGAHQCQYKTDKIPVAFSNAWIKNSFCSVASIEARGANRWMYKLAEC